MKDFHGKVAVITGAGSGMGRELAIQLAKAGAKVAISDIDTVGLAETEKRVKAISSEVKADFLNTAEREAMMDYADNVVAHFGKVNMIFNNAGIAFTGDVEVSEFKDIERVMDVDFWGVVNGTKAFLPHIIASGDGHIINTSSLFGIIGVPSQSAYNAAKFAVRGFTESLRQEMLIAKHPVQVSCVHPGGIKTNIVNYSTSAEGVDTKALAEVFNKLAVTSAAAASRKILKGVQKNKARILIGADAIIIDIFARLLGSHYQRIFIGYTKRLTEKAKVKK
ncbi:MAG: SDR family NAD(P)-dependent oxidoreductase [Mycobacteriaceae bacterium]